MYRSITKSILINIVRVSRYLGIVRHHENREMEVGSSRPFQKTFRIRLWQFVFQKTVTVLFSVLLFSWLVCLTTFSVEGTYVLRGYTRNRKIQLLKMLTYKIFKLTYKGRIGWKFILFLSSHMNTFLFCYMYRGLFWFWVNFWNKRF